MYKNIFGPQYKFIYDKEYENYDYSIDLLNDLSNSNVFINNDILNKQKNIAINNGLINYIYKNFKTSKKYTYYNSVKNYKWELITYSLCLVFLTNYPNNILDYIIWKIENIEQRV